jgi:hypothetical protein
MECKLDLLISQSQLRLRSRPCEEDEFEWGDGNGDQGLVLLEGLVMFDTLSDEEGSADVIIRTPEKFSPHKSAQRRMQVPFTVVNPAELAVSSLEEELDFKLDLEPGEYTLIYEVCVGRDVFFVLTLLKGQLEQATALKADGWGLKQGQVLRAGIF